MIKLLCGLGLCALLVACGGSDAPTVTPTPTPTPPPVAQDVGSQVEAQLTQAEATTETIEPVAIDTVTVPAPDDTEPKPL